MSEQELQFHLVGKTVSGVLQTSSPHEDWRVRIIFTDGSGIDITAYEGLDIEKTEKK